ncbi:ABC transporter permease subunit [Frankia sp. CNm7]|uniref:ABC transporter permease subunit n=1 Tax=Frankia nepalensis TaxID=1836974 RepID=A0A937URK7_9ACTN|nr:ABC transporter permease subunit [Frankia nepalensis]MBL7500554.1 ABC transporter permease subunit [Frankia nepalensis]MBL7509752.1 ABC transporter permease subunit [Frankia nepalensis]MBL7518768.1 ABC transporter permease subunit [Frankia nepalensis]MBL7627871.1 ABC transporter permease subunit [Frankia nepalensis]
MSEHVLSEPVLSERASSERASSGHLGAAVGAIRRGPSRLARAGGSSLLPVLGAIAFVALWEWTGRAGVFGKTWLPLTTILDEFSRPGRAELIGRAARATFSRAALGFGAGFALAVAAASLGSILPRARSAIGGAAIALNSIPWIALAPLLMIVVPRDRTPVVIAGLAVFFPVFVTVSAGLAGATRGQEDLLGALGAPRRRHWLLVRLPTATPSLVLAVKLALPSAIIGAVFGEWFGASRGLGLLLLTSMQNYRPALLWSVCLLIAAVTMVGFGLLSLIELGVERRFALRATDTVALPPRSGAGWRGIVGWLAFAVVAVAGWAAYVRVSGVSPLLVPAPGRVWNELADAPGLFLRSALYTLRLGLGGWLIGLAVGALLAVATWWSGLLRGLLTPMVIVARTAPTLALLPAVAAVIGYNDWSIVAICVLITFFPAFAYTLKGLRMSADGALDLLATVGAPRARRFLFVVLPASLRDMVVAMRLTAGVCVIAAVVGEYLIGQRGLGRLFADAMGRQNIGRAWAVALSIVLLSMVAFAAADRIGRAVSARMS